LLKRPSFLALSRRGRKYHTRLFLAAVMPGDTHRTRLGVTVTRKVDNAVGRNRIKRKVREFFRVHRDRLPKPVDISVIAKKEAASADTERIRRSLKALFEQIAR
jgi:ribonuclease P protein component